MAREIKDIKEFVELARRSDIKSAIVKVNAKVNANGKKFKQTKFKPELKAMVLITPFQ